jgi:cell wall assembly regulator SMI1
LTDRGETIIHDHVAFRTFNIDGISKNELGKVFESMGYAKVNDDLTFPSKGLEASYYIHTADPAQPKIFISELLTEKFSPELQAWIKQVTSTKVAKNDGHYDGRYDVSCLPSSTTPNHSNPSLGEEFFLNPTWAPVRLEDYQRFYEESEYAAWTAAFGIQVSAEN